MCAEWVNGLGVPLPVGTINAIITEILRCCADEPQVENLKLERSAMRLVDGARSRDDAPVLRCANAAC